MATSLLQLRTKSQLLYDVAGSDVLDDAQWDELVNDGYRALWDTVVDINPRFRSTPKRFTLTGNPERVIQVDPAGDNTNPGSSALSLNNGNFSQADVASTLTTFYADDDAHLNRTFTIVTVLSPTFVVVTPAPGASNAAMSGYVVLEGACAALPDDFRDAYLVRSDPGTEFQRELNRYPARIASGIYERSYDVRDRRLYIEPRQRAQGAYEMLYTPNPLELANDTDEIDIELDRFRAFVPFWVANTALAREESDQLYTPQLAYEESRVKKWAKNQRSAEPDTVEDVRGRSRWSWGWGMR